MKRILLLFSALMLSCIALWAHDVEIDGIYYDLDETNKTAGVTYRGYSSYYYNEYSGSITIPETITYNSEIYSVTSIGQDAFSSCSGLTSVTIPNSVTSIGSSAFSYCSGLTSVTIGNSVTYIGSSAFSDCSGLTSVIWNAKNCADFEFYDETPFYNISLSITSFTFGNEVEHIPACLCYEMSKLTEMTIPNSVTSIGSSAFSYCSGLTSVTIGNSVTYIGQDAFYYCSELTSITIPNSVTSIGSSAFSYCSGLTSITIPNSVTSIDYKAFYGCSRLTEVTIPNSVTYIDYTAFSDCSGLTKVNYLGTVDEWVEFDWLFGNPTSYANDLYINNELVTDVKITSAGYIGRNAFNNCKSIKSVEIGESVTSIGSLAFSYCSGLTEVTIPNSVTSIDEYAFYNTGIYEDESNWDNGVLYIDNCLIEAKSDVVKGSYTIKKGTRIIGDGAFSDCSGLTSVTIGESVTSIGNYAFYGCSGLTSVTIPNSVTSIVSLAFYDCSGLIEVTIGESVTSIDEEAFSGCDKLRKVTAYPTTVPNVYENSFAHYNAALYVPCDVYDDYFFDDVFGTFKVTECIAAEEVDAPEKVEIEVDEDNNANVIWPSTDGAKKYELEISKDGEVFCTLLFNENGQLTSIDFGNRSASVGFQFTVTGLDSASKYAYSMVAMDKKGNELQSYKGTFTTNGYVPGSGEEDEQVSITETLAEANITVSGGTISADADFSIYNTIGQDVTSFNGSLQPGVYVVALGEDRVKIMIQ